MARSEGITMLGERSRNAPWRELGPQFGGLTTASQALEKTGLNFEVIKRPLVEVELESPLSEEDGTTDGTMILGDRRFRVRATEDVALVRADTGARLGKAHMGYNIVQNTEVAKFLDPLTEEWTVDSAGYLGDGQKTFIVLKAGDFQIAGDAMEEYLVSVIDHSGNGAMKIVVLPFRLYCQNALVTGLRQALVSASVRHGRNAKADLELRVNLVAQLRKAQADVNSRLALLPQVRVTPETVEEVLL